MSTGDITADCVEYRVAAGYDLCKILRGIVDDLVRADAAQISVIGGPSSRDCACTDMLCELDGDTGNAAGATLDDMLTAIHARTAVTRYRMSLPTEQRGGPMRRACHRLSVRTDTPRCWAS